MAVLRYLPKLKRALGLAFRAYFQHNFSIKIFLIYTLSTDKMLIFILFNSFSRYQIKCVIKFLFRQLMMSYKIYLQSSSKVMANREKRGKDRNWKIRISWARKELFRWDKKYFSQLFKGYDLVKKTKTSRHEFQEKVIFEVHK